MTPHKCVGRLGLYLDMPNTTSWSKQPAKENYNKTGHYDKVEGHCWRLEHADGYCDADIHTYIHHKMIMLSV